MCERTRLSFWSWFDMSSTFGADFSDPVLWWSVWFPSFMAVETEYCFLLSGTDFIASDYMEFLTWKISKSSSWLERFLYQYLSRWFSWSLVIRFLSTGLYSYWVVYWVVFLNELTVIFKNRNLEQEMYRKLNNESSVEIDPLSCK